MANSKIVIPAAVAFIVAGAVIANETGLFDSTVESIPGVVVEEETNAQAEAEAAAKQLSMDVAACEMWAYEQAGIPIDADDPERKKYSVAKTTAIGTAAGAGVGAVGGQVVSGKAGKGAVVGAIVGSAAAFLKSRKGKKEYEAEVAKQEAQLETFEQAANTCMTAKGE